MTKPAARQIGEVKRVAAAGADRRTALRRCCAIRLLAGSMRKCKRCGRPAVRGPGPLHQRILGRWSPLSGAAGRAERRMLAQARARRIVAARAYRAAGLAWSRRGFATSQRAPARLALVQAWDKRHLAPLRWAKFSARRLNLAQAPGRRQHTAWWL